MEKKKQVLLLKEAEKPYRDVIRLFARKRSEVQKEELLKKMISRTHVMDKEGPYNHIASGLFSIAALSAAYGFMAGKTGAYLNATIFVMAGQYSRYYGSLSEGQYLQWPIHRILVGADADERIFFHEAIHFMEGEWLIKTWNSETIPTAATALYQDDPSEAEAGLWFAQKYPVRSFFYRLNRYKNGYALALELLQIKDKQGEEAAWGALYQKSQKYF